MTLASLILASASPRRADLLRAAGIPFEVRVARVDETPRAGEQADAYVRRLAIDKARAVATLHAGSSVLGADTAVVVDGQILGKPTDGRDAARMLRLLTGRSHEVLTGVCLITPAAPPDRAGGQRTEVATTSVRFNHLSDEETAWYVASGEPMDKAGAYAIQGLASRFVAAIDGSYSNVVGLPVALVYQMCRAAGIRLS